MRDTRVAALWDPTSGKSQVAMTETAARAMKIQLQILKVRSDHLVGAFAAAREEKAQAINMFASPFLASLTREIIGLAAENRLPTIYQWREQVEAGGLVSYGPELALMWRQSGSLVAKLLKGAKPGDLPIGPPTSRVGNQSQGRQDTRSYRATGAAHPRRRGDRITILLLRCASPLLAQSGQPRCTANVRLGVKRT